MPSLDKIWIYPIKSLDGVEISQASIWQGGGLAGDREFALVDATGKFVNAKRTAEIQKIRSTFDLSTRIVTLEDKGKPVSFHLDYGRSGLEAWFSQYFGFSVSLVQDRDMGFPDDTNASGPTIVSLATLELVAEWFGISLDETRCRFRTNLEIVDTDPFWEDQLYTAAGEPIPFQIGDVNFTSSNPCSRCVVPTRHSRTGERTPDFQKILSAKRAKTLPPAVPRSLFNSFYRLTLNTNIAPSEAGKVMQVGDQVSVTPLPSDSGVPSVARS
ncbi:MOSC N-terminal beta barrel domain-containing protein [Phormidium tenue FACHB-886]|nr:MOSC N-terminal beta barrel domain-containing protein [Phormidium tenue FACHB-886]